MLAFFDCALTLEFPSSLAQKISLFFFEWVKMDKHFLELDNLSVNLHLIFCCLWLPQFRKASSTSLALHICSRTSPTRVHSQGFGGPTKKGGQHGRRTKRVKRARTWALDYFNTNWLLMYDLANTRVPTALDCSFYSLSLESDFLGKWEQRLILGALELKVNTGVLVFN